MDFFSNCVSLESAINTNHSVLLVMFLQVGVTANVRTAHFCMSINVTIPVNINFMFTVV